MGWDHIIVLLVLGVMTWRSLRQSRERTELATQEQESARKTGRDQPPSLHPRIDPLQCIGCGSCVEACPEKNVLGMIDGQAELVQAANCVGHGACAKACPSDAIDLVLGTERRGVEIPELNADYQTNVPGLYVVGELGGMGLIRNAVRQGVLAVEGIPSEDEKDSQADVLDLLIVGAGPSGLAAALAAKARGLTFRVVEQETQLGGSVLHYPRRKLVMSTDVHLPLYGRVRARTLSKEELMELWQEVIETTDLPIDYGHSVTAIERQPEGWFQIQTGANLQLQARRVFLAIGRRGTPRKLGVPGEELEKVSYRLQDSSQHQGEACLVVGGGDSAIEAAVSLSEEPGTQVTLSYRGSSIWRAKPANLKRMKEAVQAGKLKMLLESQVGEIRENSVLVNLQDAEPVELDNHAVFIFAGGILPTPFLKEAGIEIKTVHGESIQAA